MGAVIGRLRPTLTRRFCFYFTPRDEIKASTGERKRERIHTALKKIKAAERTDTCTRVLCSQLLPLAGL